MPGAHRDTDCRFCGAKTIVRLQTNVYVNSLLWAVHGDIDTHCEEGALIAAYGAKNVHINRIKVICAVGDKAQPDRLGCFIKHPAPPTDPKCHSPTVNVYR